MLADTDAIRRDLLAWYDRHKRSLPWRTRRTLYGTWVSEIMLQQTTVKTVIPYYERFLARFPEVADLASASIDDVLPLWSGLGYYRRARHLHSAARRIIENGGRLPSDRTGWASLPGIGDYASGAIASMALGERVPALDANAKRVLLRWAVGDPAELQTWKPARQRRLGESMVDPDRPGDWNEAVMELGALVCIAGAPRCDRCPVSAHCRAGRSGGAQAIPAVTRKSQPHKVVTAQLVVLWRGKFLLLAPGGDLVLPGPELVTPVRRDFQGLHQGMWRLPATAWYAASGKSSLVWDTRAWARWVADLLGLPAPAGEARSRCAGFCRHTITRYRIQAQTWELILPDDLPRAARNRVMFLKSQKDQGESPADSEIGDGSVWGRFVDPKEKWPPVSRLVTKGLSVGRLTMG